MTEANQNKSTTGQSQDSRAPGWIPFGFKMTSALSPQVAARLAERLFFSARRGLRLRPEEEAILEQAERFTMQVRGETVRGFAWGSGPTVLLVHGWSGRAGQMTPFVGPLLEAGFRAVAIDMPGHGSSTGKRTSLVHFSDALSRAAALFGPVHGILAHSFGAAATTYALSRRLAAERVVFVAPTARLEPYWDQFRGYTGVSEAILQAALAHAEVWLGAPLADMHPLENAPRMKVPLLVIHDARDREVAFRDGSALALRWPGAVLKRTEGLGHTRILRDPGTAADAVEFLRGPFAGVVPLREGAALTLGGVF